MVYAACYLSNTILQFTLFYNCPEVAGTCKRQVLDSQELLFNKVYFLV
jgi:hypothetical protein